MSEHQMGQAGYSEAQRTEEWRKFHGGHLERQTKALESIKGMLVFWLILTGLGLLFLIGGVISG